jgi:isoleucyl-tRNA synthetase
MDLSKTVNLPKTDFPMKANLSIMEPDIIDFWKENGIYSKFLLRNQNGVMKVLHDGPPYSNGRIHLGHSLNKILKDIVVKYWIFKGFYSPFYPGWDTHGLPNERAAISTYKIDRKKASDLYIREKSKEIALYYSEIQKEQFIRLGVFAFWDDPYLTLDPSYEAYIIRSFGELAKKGYIYRELKPVYWCYECETSLADAEIEYKDKTSPSIVVSFKLTEKFLDFDELYCLIWTTTPWTLPANVAIAYKPDSTYVVINYKNKSYIVSKEALYNSPQLKFMEDYVVLKEFNSNELYNKKAKHPFLDRLSVFVPASYVDESNGTGLVHTAPGHGYEDYLTGRKFNLPILSPVDSEGKFTKDVLFFEGINVHKADDLVIKKLQEEEGLVYSDKLVHSYPHCWRCHNPVIFRSTYQWFLDVEKIKDKLISSVDNVEWYPSWGQERMKKMLENRPDWCLSRQRVWGVFIPVFYCKNCGEHLLDYEIIENIACIVEKEGSDIWWKKDSSYFLKEEVSCSKCGFKEFEKEKDIFDVWFESAVSHFAVLYKKKLEHPCSLYLEGSDQYRGWFQVSLITSVGIFDRPPYKKVLTHGWVLDHEGRAMHKSLGNVIDPMEIVEEYGSDILRLYFSTSEYTNDIKMSKDTLKVVSEVYKKTRNTIRFMLGNLYDFNPSLYNFNFDQLPLLEKYLLNNFGQLIRKVDDYLDKFEFHKYVYEIYDFIVHDLSSLYLDIRKDVLYTYDSDSFERRASQVVISAILRDLLVMLAPVLSFTCEQAWRNIPFVSSYSCFLQNWPDSNKYTIKNLENYEKIITFYRKSLSIFEKTKNQGKLKTSNEAILKIYIPEKSNSDLLDYFVNNKSFIKEIFRVADVEFFNQSNGSLEFVEMEGQKFLLDFENSNYHKCERCWNYYPQLKNESLKICDRCYNVLHKAGILTN